MNDLADSLEHAMRELKKEEERFDGTDKTLGHLHRTRFFVIKYTCMLACADAGLYWTFPSGQGFRLNREMNEAVAGKCWFIHRTAEIAQNRLGVVVYVPHDLFPEIGMLEEEKRLLSIRRIRASGGR